MQSKLRLAALVGLLAASGACSQNSSTATVHAPPELDAPLGAVCDLIARCPNDLPPLASHNRDECIDIVYWALTCHLGDTGPTRTEIMIDSARAQSCATALGALSCDQFRTCTSDGTCPDAAACVALFGGFDTGSGNGDVAARGERCSRYGTPTCGDADYCAPEAYDEAHGVVLCEVCAPRVTAGMPCEISYERGECAAGLTCTYAASGASATCETPRAEGQYCGGYDTECASGLFCGNGTCRSGGHAGASCTEDGECRYRENVSCVMGTCGPRRENGQPCTDGNDCAGGRCHTDGLCGLPDGTSCNGTSECRTGYCPSFSACMPRLANGATCSTDDACTSGHCDDATSTCGVAPPPVAAGGPCTSTSDCEMGLTCDVTCYRPCGSDCPEGNVCIYTGSHSECLPPQPTGASCDVDGDCTSDYCDHDTDTCQVRPEIGDPCTSPEQCYPLGYCSGGVCVARHGPDQACSGYDSCLDPFLCLNGRCTLISLSCEPAHVGQQCTYLRFCDASSYCDLSANFTCAPRHGAGQACSRVALGGDDCGPGLTCVSGTTGSTCQARIALGATCTAADVCVEGAQCIGGTCMESAGGNECHSESECAPGLYCDQHSDVCEPFRQVGDACDAFNDYRDRCDPSLWCDDSAGEVCAERPGLGAHCDRDSWCRAGATCDTSDTQTCVARVGAGQPCETSFDDPFGSNCDETLFCDTNVSPYACAARRALGASCSSGSQCTTNLCYDNHCVNSAECVDASTL